jgi:hypothetical protein
LRHHRPAHFAHGDDAGAQPGLLYFPDGRLMAEADATGATLREYIWLGDLPIAIVNRSGSTATTFFVHAGHRAEPLAVTNAARSKVWDAAYEPFRDGRRAALTYKCWHTSAPAFIGLLI